MKPESIINIQEVKLIYKEDSKYINVWISYTKFTKRNEEIDHMISDAKTGRCIKPITLPKNSEGLRVDVVNGAQPV